MKITVRIGQLKGALEHVFNAIQPRMHLLAPSNQVYLYADVNTLLIRSSNGTDTAQITIGAVVDEAGVATLPLWELHQIIAHIPINNLFVLEIPKHEISKFSVYPSIKGRLSSVCQVPAFPDFTKKLTPLFQTTEQIFRRGIEDIIHLAGNGSMDRVWFNCINLRRTQNADIEMAAGSDGALGYKILPIHNALAGDILLHAPSMKKFAETILIDSERVLNCSYHEDGYLVFYIPRLEMRFISRIQNDLFPRIDFPKEYEVDFKVQAEPFKGALWLIKPYIQENVTLRLDNLSFLLEGENSLGSVSITVNCKIERSPEMFQMAVNMRRLLYVVSYVEAEWIHFQVRIRNNQLIMIIPEDESYQEVLKYAIIP